MAINDGWLVKRATVQAVDRGNVVGGTFGGKCSRMPHAAFGMLKDSSKLRSPAFTDARGERVVIAVLSNSRNELRTGSICIWRILIVRHQLPCCHEPVAN